MKKNRTGRVAVLGSLNVDYINMLDRLPQPGETVFSTRLIQRFGGKGANQAVAAARQGARVSMIGCVGADDNGRAYAARLAAEGIDASGLSTATGELTGTALIGVDRQGENMIMVAPCANNRLRPSHVRAKAGLIRESHLLLAQLEVPVEAVITALRIANEAGVPACLNLSPFLAGFPWGSFELDSLIVNEGEARRLFGGFEERRLRAGMRRKRVRNLLITRGALPALCLLEHSYVCVPTLKVRPVDTVGAGDCFAGAYAAWRSEGCDIVTSICRANAAAAIATLKPGAQESMPGRATTIQKSASLKPHAKD